MLLDRREIITLNYAETMQRKNWNERIGTRVIVWRTRELCAPSVWLHHGRLLKLLSQNIPYNLSVHIGEPELTALESECQFFMINS